MDIVVAIVIITAAAFGGFLIGVIFGRSIERDKPTPVDYSKKTRPTRRIVTQEAYEENNEPSRVAKARYLPRRRV